MRQLAETSSRRDAKFGLSPRPGGSWIRPAVLRPLLSPRPSRGRGRTPTRRFSLAFLRDSTRRRRLSLVLLRDSVTDPACSCRFILRWQSDETSSPVALIRSLMTQAGRKTRTSFSATRWRLDQTRSRRCNLFSDGSDCSFATSFLVSQASRKNPVTDQVCRFNATRPFSARPRTDARFYSPVTYWP